MMRQGMALFALTVFAGCVSPRIDEQVRGPVDVKIIAFNDFHGALEPPRLAVPTTTAAGEPVRVPAGGAAYLASAIKQLKDATLNHVVVSAGDLISASPFVSSQFLDEPTILAMNLIGLELNAVGNHEFDRGPDELLRMQNGGCAKHTKRQPCRVDARFPGASFRFLAANVRQKNGDTLFPATSIRAFGAGRAKVKIAFIGLTLKHTPTLVVPAAVAGLTFGDEAQTVNALIPGLKAQGADAVVVVIHQGVTTKVPYTDKSCEGIDGGLLPILAKLDPAVDLVVSGHTHNTYVCDHGGIDPTRPFLVTSAGRSGTFVTDITLSIDPARRRVVDRKADNLIVQGEGYVAPSGPVPLSDAVPVYSPDPRVQALVARYAAAAAPLASRAAGRLAGPALRAPSPSGESALGNLVSDAHRAAMAADIAFTNQYGLRADLVPDAGGWVTYGQLYAVMPFANMLQIKGMSGRQLRKVLEQQFASGSNTVAKPNMLLVSQGFSYSYDLARPPGQRIIDMVLNGAPIAEERIYRVSISNFLATGGDNFTAFREGTDLASGPQDIDAFEDYFRKAGSVTPPPTDRITRLDRPPEP